MKIGVTATQSGLTSRQRKLFREQIVGATELHHGDCIGGDEELHCIAKELGLRIVIHPPKVIDKRAFCTFDEISRPLDYLDRNKNIVLDTDILLGFPRSNREELRSGTWSTIRFARKLGRKYLVILPYEPN